MNILTPPHPALRTVSEEIPVNALKKQAKVVQGMGKVLRSHPGAVGLAANQVGITKRIIVWVLPGQRMGYAINPVFIPDIGTAIRKGTEGCLSLPGQQGRVERFHAGTLRYFTTNGDYYAERAEGLLPRVWQHEIDHLNGILFTDYIPTPTEGTTP